MFCLLSKYSKLGKFPMIQKKIPNFQYFLLSWSEIELSLNNQKWILLVSGVWHINLFENIYFSKCEN